MSVAAQTRLPAEPLTANVLQQVLAQLPADALLRLVGQSTGLRRLAQRRTVWRGKLLQIGSAPELQRALRLRSQLGSIEQLDLARLALQPHELVELLRCFRALRAIHFPQSHPDLLTDELLEQAVRSHGRHLKSLRLTQSYQLTNRALQAVAAGCPSLVHLEVAACMFSDAGVVALAASARRLRSLSLAKCHLVNVKNVVGSLKQFRRLQSLSLAFNDSVTGPLLLELVGALPGLRTLDVSECIDICQQDVRELQQLRPGLQVRHTARIADHSADSIRAYLLSLL